MQLPPKVLKSRCSDSVGSVVDPHPRHHLCREAQASGCPEATPWCRWVPKIIRGVLLFSNHPAPWTGARGACGQSHGRRDGEGDAAAHADAVESLRPEDFCEDDRITCQDGHVTEIRADNEGGEVQLRETLPEAIGEMRYLTCLGGSKKDGSSWRPSLLSKKNATRWVVWELS